MYQFYYADTTKQYKRGICRDDIRSHFTITAVRPAMWEEHCLECAAPECFGSCAHYQPRSDGRCKRFENGLQVFADEKACCGQGAHVRFRKWANMMTILFPAMLTLDDYHALFMENEKRGEKLRKIADSGGPVKLRWERIRSTEYMRRRGLRSLTGSDNRPDAFLFHGYSYYPEPFSLFVEIYDDHTPVCKTALAIRPGENLHILGREQLPDACSHADYLVKVYPENDLEAEMDILWCDFVQGEPVHMTEAANTAPSEAGEAIYGEASVSETGGNAYGETSVSETGESAFRESSASDQPAATVKCVVWDLDNTVWDGILIESDPDSIQLRDGVFDTIRALDARGILQSVASKNDYEQTYPVLKRLGIAEYFLYPQICWGAKSESLRRIAEDLYIGIDTFALIDDAAFERAQVRDALPQVRVYDICDMFGILQQPEFDVPVTEEGRHRRSMYRAEAVRGEALAAAQDDTVTFLKNCRQRIRIFTPVSEEEQRRCYELVLRTNQLNMSGRKYTSEEFDCVLRADGYRTFAFSLEDDFGSYGIVGFGQFEIEEGTEGNRSLNITEFAMSCRAAGKYVESALFSALLKEEHAEKGSCTVQITKKNGLLRRTLAEIGFAAVKEDAHAVRYTFGPELKHADAAECRFSARDELADE